MKTLMFDADGGFIGLVADSALAFSRRPWFVPDFGENWIGLPMLVFRVSRLGKGIAVKFAGRYYDSVTVAVRPVAGAMPPGAAEAMDGAVIVGDWMPIEQCGDRVVIEAGGRVLTYDCTEVRPDAMISAISDFVTLKTGDVIAVALRGDAVNLVMGDKVTASAGGENILSFSVR
ncbi:MAG: hypothetical protein K2L49_03310 [Muribaculaceae bacterium]|nr:hypothetical protein [Muribaculaceae bacterium]